MLYTVVHQFVDCTKVRNTMLLGSRNYFTVGKLPLITKKLVNNTEVELKTS